MDTLAQGFALGRAALGAAALVAPGPVSRGFGLGEGDGARLAGRYLGGRDLATGIGMVLADRHGSARGWFEAAALIDFIDGAVTATAGIRGSMPRARAALVTLVCVGSGAVALYLARTADGRDADGAASPQSSPTGVPRQPTPSSSSATAQAENSA
jgi:hypothetical protein